MGIFNSFLLTLRIFITMSIKAGLKDLELHSAAIEIKKIMMMALLRVKKRLEIFYLFSNKSPFKSATLYVSLETERSPKT